MDGVIASSGGLSKLIVEKMILLALNEKLVCQISNSIDVNLESLSKHCTPNIWIGSEHRISHRDHTGALAAQSGNSHRVCFSEVALEVKQPYWVHENITLVQNLGNEAVFWVGGHESDLNGSFNHQEDLRGPGVVVGRNDTPGNCILVHLESLGKDIRINIRIRPEYGVGNGDHTGVLTAQSGKSHRLYGPHIALKMDKPHRKHENVAGLQNLRDKTVLGVRGDETNFKSSLENHDDFCGSGAAEEKVSGLNHLGILACKAVNLGGATRICNAEVLQWARLECHGEAAESESY
nr:putative germin-like protein 2-1 [Ipomoea batatas]